jgi:hypothetical protein
LFGGPYFTFLFEPFLFVPFPYLPLPVLVALEIRLVALVAPMSVIIVVAATVILVSTAFLIGSFRFIAVIVMPHHSPSLGALATPGG